jgi:hypothetical protein
VRAQDGRREGCVMHVHVGSVKTSIIAPGSAIKALTCDDAGS